VVIPNGGEFIVHDDDVGLVNGPCPATFREQVSKMTGMINDARPTSLEAFRSPPDPDMDFEAAVHYHNELRAYIRATRYAEGRQAARKAEADRLNDLVREIESATQLTSQPLGAGPNTEKWIDDWELLSNLVYAHQAAFLSD
jgi:hypothetical protein